MNLSQNYLKKSEDTKELCGVLGHLQEKKILVVGDFLLDMYTYGQVARISPEAPVPVVRVNQHEYLPGGAGNVVLNLLKLGNSVWTLGRVGDGDVHSRHLIELLSQMGPGLDIEGLLRQETYQTPLKNRVIAAGQQLVRIDHETVDQSSLSLLKQAKIFLEKIVPEVDIIAISDYGKGFITKELMREIVAQADAFGKKIIVDPKSMDFSLYSGAWLIKPNMKEAYECAGLAHSSSVREVAEKIFSFNPQLPFLMITRAKDGISLFSRNGQEISFPVEPQEVVDVTGAGDCVLSLLVYALACDLPLNLACKLANIAGTLAVRRLGCVALDIGDLAHELLITDRHNKILEDSHRLYALRKIAKSRPLAFLKAPSLKNISAITFITHLKKKLLNHRNDVTVLYLSLSDCNEEWLDLLTAIEELDFVLIQEHELNSLMGRITPDYLYQWQVDHFKSVNSLDEVFVT